MTIVSGDTGRRPLVVPKTVLLVSRVNFDAVMHAPMARHMLNKYGTKFHVLVGSKRREEQWRNWLGEDVNLLVEDDLFAGLVDGFDVADERRQAQERERRYGISYLRHVLHQDKGTAAVMLQHSPGSAFSRRTIEPIDTLVAKINRRFQYIEELIADTELDLIIARNSGIFNSIAIALARYHNIPSVWLNHLRTGKQMTWMEGPDHSDANIREVMTRLPEQPVVPLEDVVPPDDTKWALDRISNEHRLPVVAKQLAILARNTLGHTIEDIKRGKKGERLSAVASARNILAKRSVLQFLEKIAISDMEALTNQPFALFLLHLDPEYTSSTLARDFNHLHATVQQLALSLPVGMRLVIKEHVWGLGNRDEAFYQTLLQLPNVVFADHRLRSTSLASRSAFVATVAGTIVIEASLIGVPALMFTPHSEYAGLSGVRVVRNIADLQHDVAAILKPRSDDEIHRSRVEAATFRAAQEAASFTLPELDLDADGNAARNIDINVVSDETLTASVDLLLQVMNSQLEQQTDRSVREEVA